MFCGSDVTVILTFQSVFCPQLTSTIFILTLAGTDFVTCLITIPFTITMEYLKYDVHSEVVCKAYHFLITTTVPFSCVVIVAIAIDRYMCICHPFHHWMTIRRARIIVFSMGVCIFIIGGIVAAHYNTVNYVDHHYLQNYTVPCSEDGNLTSFTESQTFTDTRNSLSRGPSYTQDPGQPALTVSRRDLVYSGQEGSGDEPKLCIKQKPAVETALVFKTCQVDRGVISKEFFTYFHKLYISIFMLSCIIVLVLYTLIYRSVIAQRRKKLRIKSAQCCLLWNATSVETPPEALEMTQDIELSHVNGGGEDRYPARQNSGATAEELEAAIADSHPAPSAPSHNNGAGTTTAPVRRSSLSNARIERMRVANIKTAGTLFVVTSVFILAFLPAWLMACSVFDMNVIVFYMYFIYNVVNPFIYAFLNQNFKTELKRIFQCRKH
ncbi:orexin receptor type 2 [Plakobranchus ocellatus]|uniref:Orexin receptor type 2 n=1 Tax=Plakobranchus ocellatus TaxID=259542 RepID=A0AAV3ZQG8_9GAST|nr:orexin receptor type 2 [Plakobranchus ocellatus]